MDREKRLYAGVNKSLPSDFVWPERFGQSKLTYINRNVSVSTSHVNDVIRSENDIQEMDTESRNRLTSSTMKEHEKTVAVAASEIRSSSKVSRESKVSLDRKRLALETEKKKQEIEHKKLQMELRLIEMEQEVRNAELDLEENESEKNTGRNIDFSPTEEDLNKSLPSEPRKNVQDWLDNQKFLETGTESQVEGIFEEYHDSNKQNDIKLLCQTISNVLNETKSCKNNISDKILTRQVIEKDFPIFDGKPEDWPLFYKQFTKISDLCGYTNEEKMIKLQKCLKGEAKTSVSGMMLTSENVDLVIRTLQMRFGRPDHIIDTLISRVRYIPFMRENHLDKIIQFSNEVSNLVATIKTLDCKGHLENPQLLKELLSKLPDTLKLKWGEIVVTKHGRINLEHFDIWLKNISDAACFVNSSQVHFQKSFANFKNKFEKTERFCVNKEYENCLYCNDKGHKGICPRMKKDSIDQRWKIVTEKKLCFCCLGKNHQKQRCKNRKACGENGCKLSHHPLLHKFFPKNKEELQENRNVDMTSNSPNSSNTENFPNDKMFLIRSERNILLRMIPIKIYGPSCSLEIIAMCDEASTVSLIDENIAKDLGLQGEIQELCLQWTNDVISRQEDSQCMDIKISSMKNKAKIFTLRKVRTTKNLSLPAQTIRSNDFKKYYHLKNISVIDINNEKPMILIGQDNINLILPNDVRSGLENEPVATCCKLGWSIHGPWISNEENCSPYMLHICNQPEQDEKIDEMVRNFFSNESFGVKANTAKLNNEEIRAVEIMKNTVRRVENGFEIGLLWNSDCICLPESRTTALQRLKCVEKKCRKNIDFAKQYQLKIDDYVDKGYATKLDYEESIIEGPHTWYLPHFAVENINKPGKIRLVFDAASKSHGRSLNDYLLTGPDLLQPLVEILWKFRQRKVAFRGDVKEMFHQVKIRKEDRSAQRFLWRNLEYDREPDIYEMNVMTFGATCSPVCAQYVKNLNAQESTKVPEILTAIVEKFYVDDYLDCKDTAEEAVSTILEVKKVMKAGGFDIVNWATNSKEVRRQLNPELLESSKKFGNCDFHRVLGMWWNSNDDEFIFEYNKKEDLKKLIPTKRNILKHVMSIFDPLGLIACFLVKAKILLQDIWRHKCDWDEEIPENLRLVWKRWIEDLEEIPKLRIPRCYSQNTAAAVKFELHNFCDSSEKAFAAVSYLRIISEDNNSKETYEISLVAAKARVTPLKPLSIPRLELQAAVMASRLANSITKSLEIQTQEVVFWTDSKCILNWIRGDGRKYKQFVAHRVGEIQETTKIESWRWIPTNLNIADQATRLTNPSCRDRANIIPDEWFFGPKFLYRSEETWPMEINVTEGDQTELKKEYKEPIGYSFATSVNDEILPEIGRFSKYLRLIRSTAWAMRFIRKLKKQFNNGIELTVEELEEAENKWIRQSQRESFGEDYENLRLRKPLNRKNRLWPLCPEMENGIIVLGGRTNLATCMSERTKRPPILNPKHPFTKLLVSFFHEECRHRGVELVLNLIRQKYWIIDGRAAVKSTFSKCQKCRISKTAPRMPQMGQIPVVRLKREIRPFVNVGVDLFGPLTVVVGRRREKRWGILFTCLAIRAIHLDVVHSLSTDSTLMAIQRMIARRGKPKTIYCDNGTNFRGAARELCLRSALDESTILSKMSSKGIEFKFNPPAAPHMGGVWERLIGIVKRTIGKILYEKSLKDETLLTLLAEAEKLVNSRPLTKVSTDPNDFEALTPNHFLIGSIDGDGPLVTENPTPRRLRQEWSKSQELANLFWTRWVKEYLPTLSKRNKWSKDQQSLQVNDIVVLIDDNAPRYEWKIGRVIKIHPGPDGKVRVVDVKTATQVIRRPTSKLGKLDMD